MATRYLLLKDVESLGRSGDIVNVRPGYARNYLLPKGFVVPADKRTLGMQERLQKERMELALQHKEESDQLASKINGITLLKVVKVDPEGHMYGSVNAGDVWELLQEQVPSELDKKSIQLKHPIKATGIHSILVKLKEGVTANFTLKVMSEEGYRTASEGTTPAENQ